MDYGVKRVEHRPGVTVSIDFFDLSGDRKYAQIRDEFVSGASGVLLCFDLSSKKSFEALAKVWLPLLEEHGVVAVPRAVVGTKKRCGLTKYIPLLLA